jgi:radical SAM superfamily enzyme YgiQ (UPF0313 family)
MHNMRVTFVAQGWEQLAISQLGEILLADGHEVSLAFSASLFDDRYHLCMPKLARFFDDRADVLAQIERSRPELLALSPLTSNYQWMLSVARDARAMIPGLKVVFGGVHASAVPDVVLEQPEVDFACVGEGDLALPALIRALEAGGPGAPIPNLRWRDGQGGIVRGPQAPFIQDLDSLPPFRKRLWEPFMRIQDLYTTMASRGCPYRCTFCFNNFFANLPDGESGKYVRQRSVDHMMAELLEAKQRYGMRAVAFEDDIFTVRRDWLHAFLERYKREIRLPFKCLTHPKYIDDETAGWLAEAGCTWILMGVQSVDEDFKFKNLRRYERTNHVEKALEAFERHGIKAKLDHMFGLPDEPIAAQNGAWELYVKHRPTRVQSYYTTYLPGTELVSQGLERGEITPEEVERLERGLDFRFFRDHVAKKPGEKERLRRFKAYEAAFKCLPFVPRGREALLAPHRLEHLPIPVNSAIATTADLIAMARNRSMDLRAYVLHYLHHGVLKRFGAPASRADGTLAPWTPPDDGRLAELPQRASA